MSIRAYQLPLVEHSWESQRLYSAIFDIPDSYLLYYESATYEEALECPVRFVIDGQEFGKGTPGLKIVRNEPFSQIRVEATMAAGIEKPALNLSIRHGSAADCDGPGRVASEPENDFEDEVNDHHDPD